MPVSSFSHRANPANFGSDLISGDMVELEEMVFITLHRPLLRKRRVTIFFFAARWHAFKYISPLDKRENGACAVEIIGG